MDDDAGRMPWPARAAFGALAFLLIAFAVQVTFDVIGPPAGATFEKLATNAICVGSAALCLWRALTNSRQRTAWLLCAGGLAAWAAGDMYYAVMLWDLNDPPSPSPADIGYLAFYPLMFAGLITLATGRLSGHARNLFVDGLICALSVGALSAALLAGPIATDSGDSFATVMTNLAYPVGDLLVFALLAGTLAMTGWRLRSTWAWMAGGLAVFVITDALFLYAMASGTYETNAAFDAGWPLGVLMIAYSACLPTPSLRLRETRSVALPITLGFGSVGLLVMDHYLQVEPMAVWLAAAALLAVLARLWFSFSDNARLLATSRREALTDALTELGNRRALTADLEQLLEDGSSQSMHVLALYDLDGFKRYNDTFGHAAGDALLARLGQALQAVLPKGGRAYRMGGDEFCILCPVTRIDARAAIEEAAFALTERGEGFTVGCSYGSVLLPEEAPTPESALRLVDQRMYRDKHHGRSTVGRQSGDVLRQALSERHPELGQHLSGVASLADALARRIGLTDAEVEEVALAADLHDVGKVAIPDAILEKPAPLNATEWAFMRRHTLIGERIVGAAPALAGVARLVRSTHERVDGRGYPDGLKGNAIPLGARIIFVCDSFHAMTSQRAYSRQRSEREAVLELRRCAGAQFDEEVVDAFCMMLIERSGEADAAVSRPGSAARPRS